MAWEGDGKEGTGAAVDRRVCDNRFARQPGVEVTGGKTRVARFSDFPLRRGTRRFVVRNLSDF